MKRVLLAFTALAFLSSAALAKDCGNLSNQTIAAYAGLGGAGCTVSAGGAVVDFSNFQLLSPSLTGSGLDLTLTANTGPDFAGFTISTNGTLAAPETVVLSYNVSVLSGSLDQALFQVAGSGDAVFSLTEDLLQAAGITPASGGPIVAGGTVSTFNSWQTVSFNPSLSTFTVRDTLVLSAGTVSGIDNGYAAPEPATFALAGLALAGLGILKRRQSKRQ